MDFRFDELDADYMIRRLPGTFAAGEMLDWEAPTGGYLLQASFATGAAAGRGALKWLEKRSSPSPFEASAALRHLRMTATRERHPELRALARLEGCAGGYLNFPRAATGSVPRISSPRTITTSSIMLTTTQT